MATDEDKFTPKGQPLSAEELAEYTEDGVEVLITRQDLNQAIATADSKLKKYLQATQHKQKS